MATTTDVVTGVRQKMRDWPKIFQTDVVGSGNDMIFELPVVMVDPLTLRVFVSDTAQATVQIDQLAPDIHYTLDAHHGMLLLLNNRRLQTSETLNVFGSHYEWFIDNDILSETGWVVEGVSTGKEDGFFESFTPDDPRLELVERGVLLACLWNLLIEASLDIDVRNPEGVDIPVAQRFTHLQGLVAMWTERYDELAAMLNLGVSAIQMLNLRRVSYSTGRLVPTYVEQEFNDRATPTRLYPYIDHDQGLASQGPPNEPATPQEVV